MVDMISWKAQNAILHGIHVFFGNNVGIAWTVFSGVI
jgi:hypothetical protein